MRALSTPTCHDIRFVMRELRKVRWQYLTLLIQEIPIIALMVGRVQLAQQPGNGETEN